jgi:hypothetical protein
MAFQSNGSTGLSSSVVAIRSMIAIGFLRCHLAALAERGTGSALVRLLSIYCIHFDPRSPQIEEIARFLRSSLSRLPALWRQRHEASRLLDPSKASEIIGGLLIDARAPYDALGRFGLAGRRGASGLVTHVVRHVLANLRVRLEREASLANVNSIIRWASTDGRSTHAQGTQAAIAEALLLPWQTLQPPGPVRQAIEKFLIAAMRDPRLHPGAWVEVAEAAKLIIRRWLAENSLEQFLRVVDRVAPRLQWHHRRVFWNAYFKGEYVLDAWVAFGHDGT